MAQNSQYRQNQASQPKESEESLLNKFRPQPTVMASSSN